MKHFDIAQGEDGWFNLRLGIPTASEFSKIITPKQLKLSSQAEKYADLKIAEIMLGEGQGQIEPTYWMERGAIMEADARQAYEFLHDVKVDRGGFFTTDDGHFGCSPDFLVGDDGLGEIKCLTAPNHVGFMVDQCVKPEHMPQIQGQMLVAERQYCDWFMYHPDLPRVSIRVERDEDYIDRLRTCLYEFRTIMSKKIEKLQADDNFSIKQPKKPDHGDVYGESTYMAG